MQKPREVPVVTIGEPEVVIKPEQSKPINNNLTPGGIDGDDEYIKEGQYYQCKKCKKFSIHEGDVLKCTNDECRTNDPNYDPEDSDYEKEGDYYKCWRCAQFKIHKNKVDFCENDACLSHTDPPFDPNAAHLQPINWDEMEYEIEMPKLEDLYFIEGDYFKCELCQKYTIHKDDYSKCTNNECQSNKQEP